ncbi:hypothetical protein ACROYT_G013109 [Oculina patagonica]
MEIRMFTVSYAKRKAKVKKSRELEVISELEDEEGNTITDDKEILLQIENFNKDLHSSKIGVMGEKLNQFTEDITVPQLSNEERENLEGLLTYEECKTVLDSFKNDKSPGEDGFTAEFYSFFFDLVGNDLVDCLNAGDIESAVVNNGFATDWIKPSAGVRQGCPLSPYLFILTVELMSNKIRQSSEVLGISLLNREIKLSQFADDTNLFCADLTSVKKGLDIIASFGDISGLRA